MPLMLLFQVHRSFPLSVFLFCFVFLVLVRSVWTYIFFYISWDLCGCKNMQMSCRSACFKRFMCVRLFVSLCFSCAFSPFFFFLFFFFCFLTLSNCRGKTHCKSFTVPWGVFWASGGRLCCSEPASPTCPHSGLPCGGGWQWDIWWVTDHRPPPHPSVCCIIVRLCVNQMSVWATIPMPVFALNLPPIALPPPLPHPPPVGLSE